MSVLTSNVQFNVSNKSGAITYTEVSFTYRGRSYVAEVQHSESNGAVVISDIHNPSNFNPLKSPKKQDIERCLINEYNKHVAAQTNTVTVGSISKFSVVGSREVESEAAGKYTVYDVEFEYNASMYNAQVVKTANGLTSFSYMCKKDSMCRSTLATMDKVRTEVRQAFSLATANEAVVEYAKKTEEHMTTNTAVVESTMKVVGKSILLLTELYEKHGVKSETRINRGYTEVVFNKQDHHLVLPLNVVKSKPDYVRQHVLGHFEKVLKQNKFDTDEALKHFEEVSGLVVTTLWDREQQEIYFMTDSHIFVPFELRELQDRHRTLYSKLTHTFRLKHQVEHRHARIDKIASLLNSNGYNVAMSDDAHALTLSADGHYRYITIAELFFLDSAEIIQYADAQFAEGV